MARAFTGIGTQLLRGTDDSPQEFEPINGITQMSPDFGSKSLIDVTDLANTSGFADYIGGLKEGGQVAVVGNYSSADESLALVEADYKLGAFDTPRNWRLSFPQDDGSPSVQYAFEAYVQSYSLPGIQPKDAVKFNFTLKLTGDVSRV